MMLTLRRFINLPSKTSLLENLVRANCRYLSASPCMFKLFPREGQRKEVYLPRGRKSILASELMKRMNLGTKFGILGKALVEAGLFIEKGIDSTVIPIDLAELIVLEFDMIPVYDDVETENKENTNRRTVDFRHRPPVVTIMGHVDHGKTTLLDYLRKSSVTEEEAGGITQHIGAFSVSLHNNKKITFIDTPGHAVFGNMRARGAYVTDIVVLVVAADEGVKAQTLESLKHIRDTSANVIVALNKIDKPKKKLDVTKTQLLGFGLHLEEFGGNVQCIEISALKGTNVSKLIEAILLEAEMADLKADFKGPVAGIVLESKVDVKHGCVASVLVGQGELKSGAVLISGNVWCKVKKLLDENNQEVTLATPSMPVRVTGWKEVPNAGEAIKEVSSETEAKDIVEERAKNIGTLSSELVDVKPLTSRNLEILYGIAKKKGPAPPLEVNPKLSYDSGNKIDLIIKGDVTGSVEAILQILKTYNASQISLSVLHAGVGDVTEGDVTTAAAFKGTILGFNVKTPKAIQQLAEQNGVTVKHYSVIYKLFEELKQSLTEKLPLLRVDTEKGRAVVLQIFKLTGSRKAIVAGCSVKSGALNRKDLYKVLRYNTVIYEGKLASIKRGVEDATSVPEGNECGLAFENFTEIQQGDVIICFTSKNVKQEIDWKYGF